MTATRHERLAACRLYLIATVPSGLHPAKVPSSWWTALEASVRGGAAMVQLRAKLAGTDDIRRLVAQARRRLGDEVLILVNDDLQAGMADEADGAHLGREDLERPDHPTGPWALRHLAPESPAVDAIRTEANALFEYLRGSDQAQLARRLEGLHIARSLLGHDRLLGTSTRSYEEVQIARAGDADHVGFGAMAVSETKLGVQLADPMVLARCAASAPRYPIFPIGGLGPDNLDLVRDAGIGRAAVGSALLGANDPWAVAADLVRRLHEARAPFRFEQLPPWEDGQQGEASAE